jgi:hypothetical protein
VGQVAAILYWRSRRGLPTGPQLAATHRGIGPPPDGSPKDRGTGRSRSLPASRLGPSSLPTPGSDRVEKGTGGRVVRHHTPPRGPWPALLATYGAATAAAPAGKVPLIAALSTYAFVAATIGSLTVPTISLR